MMREKLLEVFGNLEGAKVHNNFLSFIINPEAENCIMITAGIHGNEPAPVIALFEKIREGINSDHKIVICPCVNTSGFVKNKANNHNNVDLNRDSFSKTPQDETKELIELVNLHKPIFSLNMHEDPDEEKFFLYNENSLELSKHLIEEIKKETEVYKNHKVHNDSIKEGIITNGEKNGSFEDWLTEQEIPNICTETPGLIDIQERVRINKKIIELVLKF